MKTFIEILISVAFLTGLYFMFKVSHASEVDKQYTIGYDNGGK